MQKNIRKELVVKVHLHCTLSQFNNFKQSHGLSSVSILLSHAVCFPPSSGHAQSLVCRRLPGLLIGRLQWPKYQKQNELKPTPTSLTSTLILSIKTRTRTCVCFPGLPLFFLPLISGSSISVMFMLKLTVSVAPDSLEESLKEQIMKHVSILRS